MRRRRGAPPPHDFLSPDAAAAAEEIPRATTAATAPRSARDGRRAGGTVLVVTGDSGVVNGTGTVRARGADAALDPSQYHPTSPRRRRRPRELPQRGLTVDVRGGGGCQRGGAGTVFYRAKAELDALTQYADDLHGGDRLLDVSVEPSNISTSRSPRAPSFPSAPVLRRRAHFRRHHHLPPQTTLNSK